MQWFAMAQLRRKPTALKLLSATVVWASFCAAQSEWGQCGGVGWTGSTLCPSGSVCHLSLPIYAFVDADHVEPQVDVRRTKPVLLAMPSSHRDSYRHDRSLSTHVGGVQYYNRLGFAYGHRGECAYCWAVPLGGQATRAWVCTRSSIFARTASN